MPNLASWIRPKDEPRFWPFLSARPEITVLNAAVAAGAPLYWLSIALNPWPGMAIQLAAGAIVFLLLAVAFFAGMMGGGDVKLAAALALWFSVGGVIGATVVGNAVQRFNPESLRTMFGVFLVIMGVTMVARRGRRMGRGQGQGG